MQRHVLCWLGAVLLGSASLLCHAAPPLSGGVIRDLGALEQALGQGRLDHVVDHGRDQARRFASGNAADRYASALYRQLVAGALAEDKRYAEAAEQLAEARQQGGADRAQRRRWLREQARLTHAAGDNARAIDLLSQWLEGSEDNRQSRGERWHLIGWLAREKRWEDAARALDAAGEVAGERQRRLALAVNLNAGRMERALGELTAGLGPDSSADEWRQAAGVAQRAGQPGVAAGLWDTGWRLGRLGRPADYWQLIDLHLAGGTPARAAELLDEGLAQGRVVRSELTLRLRATAWQQARDAAQALATQRALALHTQSAHEWRTLGQLAYAWGEGERARTAFERAVALGDEQAEKWLAGL